MQKYRLRDFEFSINPATWNTAQDLVQDGAVRSLKEVEKHFWVALIDEPDGAVEVEIMLTPHRIKAYTCECWAENRRLMCPHIAAALLKIRQFLQQNAEERRERLQEHRKPEQSRLTVQSVLQDAPSEALFDFVRDYARRDRDFALALKTWFAGSVTGTNNPFALVLESAIPKNSQQQKIRESEYRRLRKTLDDLSLQMQEAANEGSLPTVFQIASAIMGKIGPLLTRLEEERLAQLRHYCHQALQHIGALHGHNMSPELTESVWQLQCQWLESSWFPAEFTRDLTAMISRQTREQRCFDDIQTIFDRHPAPIPTPVLHTYLASLAERNVSEAVVRVLESYADSPAVVRDVAIMLFKLNHLDTAAGVVKHFTGLNYFKPAQQRELEDILLQIAEKQHNPVMQVDILRRRFLESGNAESFHKFKKAAGSAWPTHLSALMLELRQLGDQPRIATVLAAEQEFDALAALLANTDDLNQLQTYDTMLSDEFLEQQYTRILGQYLTEHFGLPASAYVRTHLNGFVRKGRIQLVRNIISAICRQFSDRTALPAELEEVFPRNMRQSGLPQIV